MTPIYSTYLRAFCVATTGDCDYIAGLAAAAEGDDLIAVALACSSASTGDGPMMAEEVEEVVCVLRDGEGGLPAIDGEGGGSGKQTN